MWLGRASLIEQRPFGRKVGKEKCSENSSTEECDYFPLKIFMFMDLVSLIAENRRGQNVLNGFQNTSFNQHHSIDWLQG